MVNIKTIVTTHTFLAVAGSILAGLTVYFNGIHGIYLYDTSIVYYYGYLLKDHYIPFHDFITPLLPFPGLLQEFFYLVFGLNYISGVYAACCMVVLEFLSLYFLLTSLLSSKLNGFLYAFLLTLSSIPFIGNLYYNHFNIALVSVLLILGIYNLRKGGPGRFRLNALIIAQYILLAFIFLTKPQAGVYLCGTMLIIDLYFSYSAGARFKLMAWQAGGRLLTFIIAVTGVILLTHADMAGYLGYIRHISLMHNLARSSIYNYTGLPTVIDSGIVLSPTLIYLMYIFYLVSTRRLRTTRWYPIDFLLITNVYIIGFILTMNSYEPMDALIPDVLLLMVFLEILVFSAKKHYFFRGSLKPAILTLIFCFSITYALSSFRKGLDETTGDRIAGFNPNKNRFSFNEATPQLARFFDKIKVSESQYRNFIVIDSVIALSKSRKVFFGPELEMFNIVYGITPPKPWPVWVHPGLTVTDIEYSLMDRTLKAYSAEIIVLSRPRQRMNYLPFINAYLKKDYSEVSTGSTWIQVFRKSPAH